MKNLKLLFVLLCIINVASAKTLYVKPDVLSTAWSNVEGTVYTSISTAYSAAVAGDQVWVSAGEYVFSEMMSLKSGVSLYGGFAGTETSLDDRAKKEGGHVWDFVNETVVTRDEALTASNFIGQSNTLAISAIIDGITFEKSIGSAVTVRQGGIVQNCIFRENISTVGGGGVQMYMGGTVRYCYFYKNRSRLATEGVADTNGGAGLYAHSTNVNTPCYVENCFFDSNVGLGWATGGGAGMRANAATTVANCIFYNNMAAGGKGSAIFSSWASNTFVNCLIYNNTGHSAIYANDGGNFINMTICNNVVTNPVHFAKATANGYKLVNSIVWNNKTAKGTATKINSVGNTSSTTLSYLACNNGASGITGAITTDMLEDNFVYDLSDNNTGSEEEVNYPEFVLPTSFVGVVYTSDVDSLAELSAADWKIKGSSFLINKGNNEFVPLEYDTDLSGKVRALTEEDRVDLGVYEVEPSNPTAIAVSSIEDEKSIYAASGVLHVGAENSIVSVFDISGKLVAFFRTGNSMESVILESGIYIVKVESEGGSLITEKVIL